MSRITDALIEICGRRADSIAVIYAEKGNLQNVTFAQLEDDISQMAGYLRSCGAKRGDRILAFASSSYRLCVFMLASLTLGISVMYVDIFARQEALKKVFADYRPDILLVSDKTRYLRFFFGEIGRIKRIINIDKAKGNKDNKPPEDLEALPEDTLALLTMTTGSTGNPKTALRTHGDLMAQLGLINDNLDTTGTNETVFTTSYIYVFANILNGFTTVLPCLDLGASAKKINKRLSVFSSVPVTMMITSPDFCLKADNIFEDLRLLYFGGAILNLNEAKKIQKKFSRSENFVIYGSTECSIMCKIKLCEYIERLEKDGMAPLGHPVKGVDIKLTDKGEITIGSNALLKHYLISDSSTKSVDNDGILRHHTNDMAFLRDGVYYYRGKNKYYVTINGKKIYCNEIEQKITSSFSSAKKCAVLEKNGCIHIYVQKSGNIDADDIRKLIQRTYGTNNVKAVFVKSVPCDVKHHTKIDYEKLRKITKRC